MGFTGRTAVVTGAGSGIGRATAALLGERGADVVVADIDGDAAEETAAAIDDGDGGTATAIEVDVTDAAAVQAMVEHAVDTFGGLDVLHNNAGVTHDPTPVEAVDEATWDRVVDVNLKGVFLGAKHAVPVMREAGGGVIVNTASGLALRTPPPAVSKSLYATTKAGVVKLSQELARELAPDDIRVNAICPGLTETAMLRRRDQAEIDRLAAGATFGRLDTPADVARVVAFLASDEAASVTGVALPLSFTA